MRFGLKRLCLLAVALLTVGIAGAASFKASLDRDDLALGESAMLSLTFEGGQASNLPTPRVPGLQITQSGTSQSMSIVNGAMSSTTTVNFTVTPQRAGEFTIPPLRTEVAGQQLSTAPLKLIVSKVSAPSAAAIHSGSEQVFLKLHFPRQKVFAGECILAQVELYLRDDVSGINGFNLNSSVTEGFSAGKLVELQSQRRRVQIGNRIYTQIPLALPLTVIKTGKLELGPLTATAVVTVNGRGGIPGFEQFFGQQKQVPLATDAINVESQPLPMQNRPADFSGAVGQFDMAASAGPSRVTVGDPVTVRVQISGRGSLDSLTLPSLDSWKSFKAYPPTTKLETTDQFGFQGTKKFEQIVTPINSDVHEIPALTFTYFNPEDGQYHTLAQPAMPLTVKAAGATALPPIAAGKNTGEEKPAQDIAPSKDKLGPVTMKQMPLVAKPAFLLVQSVPVLAFIAAFVWRKRTDNLANNPRLRRQRAVASLIAAGKSDLKKFAAENKPDEFFATLFRLLQEQLGERLDCPASAITENVVEENPALKSAPAALRDALREQFQLCNQARYAPVRGTSELNSVAAQFEKLLAELQNLKS